METKHRSALRLTDIPDPSERLNKFLPSGSNSQMKHCVKASLCLSAVCNRVYGCSSQQTEVLTLSSKERSPRQAEPQNLPKTPQQMFYLIILLQPAK